MAKEKKIEETPEESPYELMDVGGDVFYTTYNRKFGTRKPYIPHNPKEATAFIPGTIQKVFVKEGQPVKKGDKLLILEAMKMKNILTAEVDGTVKVINCEVGSKVSKNVVLVEIE
jgi:biotin carboxyl carrier protein